MFTADHHGFYLNELPFYPLVQEDAAIIESWSNVVLIRMPASLNDNLDWSEQINLAHEVAKKGKYILWEIELHLASFIFMPQDSASFFSFSLACEEFSKKIWPLFNSQTFGVAIYRGLFDPFHSFPLKHWQEFFSDGDHTICAVDALSEYLHRLVSFLPEQVLPLALMDVSEISSATRAAQLFSKERFEYLHFALKGAKAPFSGLCWQEGFSGQGWIGKEAEKERKRVQNVTTGVYLPKDECLSSDVVKQLDRLLANLIVQQLSFRIIHEECLTQQWDGLDQLIVPSDAVCAQGKRKLQGFIAAGGTVLSTRCSTFF